MGLHAEAHTVTYTAGIIGLSWVGESHREAYAATDGVEVAAIADVDEDRLAECGEEWGIPEDRRYQDHTDLLVAEDLDAVSVATPTFLHRDHVVNAADAAADPDVIWVEKPIAGSVAEADQMIAACEAANADLVVNHARRFREPYEALEELVREGHVGEVQSVHVAAPEELLRNGTHYVDLVNFLLDEHYEWGVGTLTETSEQMDEEFNDCGGAGMMRTTSGAHVHVDCTMPRGRNDSALRLVGTEGKLAVDLATEECRHWRLKEDDEAAYGLTHVETDRLRDLNGFGDLSVRFRNGAEHVVDLLEGNVANRSPGTDARNVLEAIVALFVTHYTSGVVDLPLKQPLRGVQIQSR